MPETRPCPRCASPSIPIVFGLPSFELFEAAERGEVALGGCVVSDVESEWQCSACGAEF
ncbi:MAG: hypothetical protein Q8M65_11110 [Rhodoglobus sp.]|nr:hypothetical protein [Rhodoglobus sp.]